VGTWSFAAPLWEWGGRASWYFVTVPASVSDEIANTAPAAATGRGFGSVRVEVSVGTSRWRTSVFPDSAAGCFVLPIKKSVRTAEGLQDGSPVAVELALAEQI
jgi:hypothetical protein